MGSNPCLRGSDFGARVDGIGGDDVGWATDLEGSIAGDKEVLGGEVIAAVAVAVIYRGAVPSSACVRRDRLRRGCKGG